MSGKGKEIVEEDKREIIDHWSHQHPLTLMEIHSRGRLCSGCQLWFSFGEEAYACTTEKCEYKYLWHEECARQPRKIRHPLHPHHILLIQKQSGWSDAACAICKYRYPAYRYKCIKCDFWMHTACAHGSGVVDINADNDDEEEEEEEEERRTIRHESHPNHDLRLYERCSFKCDGCGTTRRGKLCICTRCQYWLHEECANLEQTIKREDHHHPLSLSYQVPLQYVKFNYRCDVCYKYLLRKYWIYHCRLCSFAVHVKCASKTNIKNALDLKGIVQLPTNDVAEELIRPFVLRLGGTILAIPRDDEMVVKKYEFIHHEHQLTLISSPSSHRNQEEEEDDDDDDDYGKRSELICDGCITHIFQSSSSSFSSEKNDRYYYMSCSECKYYLHLPCFSLPHHLPASLALRNSDAVLKSCDKLKPWKWEDCSVCNPYQPMNGLYYVSDNGVVADIKCASLPETIYHKAHPQHLLKFRPSPEYQDRDTWWRKCASGCELYLNNAFYECESCEFMVHVYCIMRPASVRSRRWDKHHPLQLMHDAHINHPGEFYCDACETEMNPKSWMYHCRECDLSFHPRCLRFTSGRYRNIKFGGEYEYVGRHPHRLTYQLLTTKRRCDLCGHDKHERPGFLCASCNFFICLIECGRTLLKNGGMHATHPSAELNELFDS